jgi:hypothetical protein
MTWDSIAAQLLWRILYPSGVIPHLGKQTRLAEGEERRCIEELQRSFSLSPMEIYVQDVDEGSKHSRVTVIGYPWVSGDVCNYVVPC